jgi:hypothetical protein
MDTSLWVPWVLVVALALPVLAARATGPGMSRGATRALLVPAGAMTVAAAWMSVDAIRVDQGELDAAVADAVTELDGSFGPVNAHDVTTIVSDRLGHDVWAQRSDPEIPDAQSASWTIEVRLAESDAEPASCVAVELGVFSADAPDLRFADVSWSQGPCAA